MKKSHGNDVTVTSDKVITRGTIGWKLHCSLSRRCESGIQGRKNFRANTRQACLLVERFLFFSTCQLCFVYFFFFFFWQIIGRMNLNETNVREPKKRVFFGDTSRRSIVGRKFIWVMSIDQRGAIFAEVTCLLRGGYRAVQFVTRNDQSPDRGHLRTRHDLEQVLIKITILIR